MPRLFVLNFRSGLLIGFAVAIAVAAAAIAYERYDTQTLKRTLRRDAVLCGVNTGLPGFSSADEKGNWSGFDVDFCRAIAAAIFDDPTKVKFIPLDANERFTELQKRKVDVLSRNTTWNLSRETNYALHFAAVSYYDGQGFMVPKARNVESALELDGAKVCVQSGTTTELNLADYFRANNMKYQEMKFAKMDDVFKAYDGGQCDVLTTDVSRLYALRLKLSKPNDHVILPDVMRFVGTDGTYGEELGLTKDWAARIIRHVGNYGEVYERNVGVESDLGIPRGLNELWNAGGILYAPPIR